jgi:hypothetical protein
MNASDQSHARDAGRAAASKLDAISAESASTSPPSVHTALPQPEVPRAARYCWRSWRMNHEQTRLDGIVGALPHQNCACPDCDADVTVMARKLGPGLYSGAVAYAENSSIVISTAASGMATKVRSSGWQHREPQ